MEDDWRILKTRDFGAYRLELIALTVDGLEHFEIVVNCVVQFIGSRTECEGKWHRWVRTLKNIARADARGI